VTTTTSSLPRRGRRRTGLRASVGRLAALVVGTSLLVGATTGAAPGPAAAAPAPLDAAPAAGPGAMDADQIPLSGPAGASSARAAGDAPAPTGWSETIVLLPGTQMVALSWDGGTSGPAGPASARLALRSRGPAGSWTDWLPLAPDPADQGGEGAGRVGSDVVWLGSDGADTLEVRVDAGPVSGLELLRMRYHEGEPVAVEAPPESTSRAAAARPTIRPRSDWASGGWRSGTSGCGSGPSVASRLDHVVVHHTASTNSYTQAQVPGLIDGIYRYHTGSLGWCDIAYNFVVDKYGTIWQGRSGDVTKPVVGGHAMGFNTYSSGVTLLGQFEPGASPAAATPTSAMINSAARLIGWKLSLHGLNPKGSVTVTSGGSTRYSAGTRVTLPVVNYHQQSSTTACPGASVISRMGTIRDLAAQHMGGSGPDPDPDPEPPTGDPDPSRWRPFPDAQTLTYRQYVDFLRNPGTYEGRTWWNTNLVNGNTNRNALVVALLESGELQRRTAAPVRLYLAYFDRAPDHPGLRYWWARMDAGTSIRKVSASFADSAEFRRRYGSLSDREFVRLVYRNVLGREPDPSGQQYWEGRLSSGAEDRGGVMAQFSESSEYRGQTRSVVEAVVTHDAMLQRAATTDQMHDLAVFVEADRSSLVNQIFGSAEYAARFS